MLRITVPAREFYDEAKEEFVEVKEQTLVMEHSLISISKWESKWKKPYLSDKYEKTQEEILDYLRCMTVQPTKVDPLVYASLSKQNVDEISAYINDPMTATTITRFNKAAGPKRETLTSELIYYYMIAQNIPVEFEKWHINRLITLIEVCAIKNDPHPKKMSSSAIMRQNHALNKARRARYGTKG